MGKDALTLREEIVELMKDAWIPFLVSALVTAVVCQVVIEWNWVIFVFDWSADKLRYVP